MIAISSAMDNLGFVDAELPTSPEGAYIKYSELRGGGGGGPDPGEKAIGVGA